MNWTWILTTPDGVARYPRTGLTEVLAAVGVDTDGDDHSGSRPYFIEFEWA